jgi:two-component system, NarL family, sensor histidine kinase NreB
VLDEYGLVAALKGLGGGLEELGGPKVAFEIDVPAGMRLPADLETSLFRITQEALTNVVKHAEATTARVILTCQKQTLLLAVEDDGRGFSPAHAKQDGFGLVGVRERVASLNGELDIQSRNGAGSRLTIELPLA